MGIVYLAKDIFLDELRALKFLAPERAASPEAVQRFLREAQKAAKIGLHQPNIVKTLALRQDEDGSFYIEMEFVDGPSLEALMEAAPQGLPVERALAIVRGIARGLEAAHGKGMVHRDIKPGNILLGKDENGEEIAKIADFGIVTGAEEESRLTRTGTQPLTPQYASPEQWKGVIPGHQLDGRTDIYALGCVFFQMLTGLQPFHGDDLRDAHMHTQPPPPSILRPELAQWSGLDAVVLRMMAKAREHRFANVREFEAALNEIRRNGDGPGGTLAEYVPGDDRDVKEALPSAASSVGVRPQRTVKAGRSWIFWMAVGGAFLIVVSAAILLVQVFGLIPQSHLQQPQAGPGAPTPNATAAKDAAAAQAKEAIAMYNAKQYAEAAPLLEKACNGGSGESCSDLGESYYYAHGVDEDFAKAIEFYTKACDGGYAIGCRHQGSSTEDGKGVKKDAKVAAMLYQRACDGGDAFGCNNLGLEVERKDPKRAAGLYRMACDGGDLGGCVNLGLRYDDGKGVDHQDSKRAAELYKKACDGGNSYGCETLASDFQHGWGVKQNLTTAKVLYQKACRLGNKTACETAQSL
jgi:TPR repeat protein